VRLDLRKIAFLLLLAPTAAYAQLWLGPGAVEVRVEDQKGLPVAGAQVVVQYKAVDPKDGPPAVLTDARGKANVSGLAEGPWHLEVSHDGFMTYLAEVTVREKGRPVLEEAAQFNVTGATRTMRVQISRGRSGQVVRTPIGEPAPTPTPAPAAPETAPAPSPEPVPTRPAPAPPKQAPEPTPPAPQTPAPKPRPASPAPMPAPPATTVPPVATPKPPQPPPEKPGAPPPQVPAPAPPAPAVQAAPRTEPAPLPTPSTDPVRLRTSKDRTCFECPPGESALSTEWVVPPGGSSGCGGDIAAQLANGEIPSGLPAGCHVLRIALPAGTRYTGYRYEVQVGGDSLDCLAGQSCPQSTGRWPINPVLLRKSEGTVILAPFEAGPADRERRAVFTAYFTAGTAKRPR